MRLSAKAKWANELAAARAHVEQVNRHCAVVQADNAKLDAAGKRVAALIEDRDNTIKAQANHIATFKAEVLALTVANAEMRGYIGRTLEDDRVREVGPTVEQPPQVHMQNVTPMPAVDVRTGPAAMNPPIIVGIDMSSDRPSARNPMGLSRQERDYDLARAAQWQAAREWFNR